jgi:hypothetical protein
MNIVTRRVTAPIAILIALTMAPALSGCFGNPIEGIIEGATGGEVDLGGTTIPDGFPTAEVPIVSGEIIFGASLGSAENKAFNVSVRVPNAQAIDGIKAELEAAGFEAQGEFSGSNAEGGTFIATSDSWGVLVVVAEDGENGFIANYTVTSAEPNNG